MQSCSTGRLAGIDLDYSGNMSEVITEGSRRTPGPLDKVRSLLENLF